MERKTSREIGRLTQMIQRELYKSLPEELSPQYYNVVRFLYRKRRGYVYQKDIEAHLRLSRSGTSELLRDMEEQGLLIRKVDPEDARLKRVSLTERAKESYEAFRTDSEALDRRLADGISEPEMEVFWKVADQIRENLSSEQPKQTA